jgi:tetratricopeptide (TPR) repeat protein
VLALAALTACGGDSKKAKTTPSAGSTGTVATGAGPHPEDVDPQGDVPGGSAGGGGDTGAVAGGGSGTVASDFADVDGPGGAGAGGDPAAAGGAAAARIEPPTLDKSPEETRRLVTGHLQTAREAMRQSRPDDAIVEARRALKLEETSVPAMVVLAHAYVVKGYYDKAEAIVDIAAKRPDGPQDHQLHFLFGLVYDKTDRAGNALTAYEKAIAVKADYRSGLVNAGASYLRLKRFEDAIRIYERLTNDLGDKSAASWANLGSAYRGRSADFVGDAERRNRLLRDAEKAYKQAMTADQRYAAAYYNLGLLYLDADPFPAADNSDMDALARLERARTYFQQYRGMAGADVALADEQEATATKLYDREVKAREKRAKADEKRRKAEEKRKALEEEKKRREGEGGGGEGGSDG